MPHADKAEPAAVQVGRLVDIGQTDRGEHFFGLVHALWVLAPIGVPPAGSVGRVPNDIASCVWSVFSFGARSRTPPFQCDTLGISIMRRIFRCPDAPFVPDLQAMDGRTASQSCGTQDCKSRNAAQRTKSIHRRLSPLRSSLDTSREFQCNLWLRVIWDSNACRP